MYEKKNKHDVILQLDQMRDGVEYKFEVSIRKFKATLRPLTISEMNNVSSELVLEMQKLDKASQTRLEENIIFCRKILEKASTSSPEVNDPQIPGYIIDKMTNDEVQYIYKQWIAGCDRVNPMLEKIPVARIKELAEELKKSPLAAIELSFLELVNVCQLLTQND